MTNWRYEVKLTCDELHLETVRSWVKLHHMGFVETYPPRYVSNLYFDTPKFGLLDANLGV